MNYQCTLYLGSRFSGIDSDEAVQVYEGTAQIEELDIILDCLASYNVEKNSYEITRFIAKSICALSVKGLPDLHFENDPINASLSKSLYDELKKCAQEQEIYGILKDDSKDAETVVH